jgi:hypothetical protein
MKTPNCNKNRYQRYRKAIQNETWIFRATELILRVSSRTPL